VLIEFVTGLSVLGVGVLPLAALARGTGEKVSRIPEAVLVENSQTMMLLSAHKNVNPTITPGAQLAIVDNSALESETDQGAFTESGIVGSATISVYTVREGDTLAAIAKMFGVTVNTIRWANDISGSVVRPGTELVILPVSGVRHEVKLGDTLQSIAKKYKADLGDILTYNNLSLDAKLSPGDEIIVPDGEIATVAPSSSSLGSGAPSYSGYYIRPVKGGRKSQGIHGHNGVDLAALPIGASVMAAADGKVLIARSSGYNGGYGAYVVVSHANGTQTLYAHLSSVKVSAGQRVIQGQVLGGLGNSGKSTGPHLHFEIRGAKNPF
jgi:LysM repeat protein